jgi:hypothetical protein
MPLSELLQQEGFWPQSRSGRAHPRVPISCRKKHGASPRGGWRPPSCVKPLHQKRTTHTRRLAAPGGFRRHRNARKQRMTTDGASACSSCVESTMTPVVSGGVQDLTPVQAQPPWLPSECHVGLQQQAGRRLTIRGLAPGSADHAEGIPWPGSFAAKRTRLRDSPGLHVCAPGYPVLRGVHQHAEICKIQRPYSQCRPG